MRFGCRHDDLLEVAGDDATLKLELGPGRQFLVGDENVLSPAALSLGRKTMF